jgi:glyoxylase-like metal-dependent hydrolase (beta-lactamase superfamily II)
MDQMKQGSDSKALPVVSVSSGIGREVTSDVYYYTDQIVNVVFIGEPGNGSWVMIDCGMPGSGKELLEVAENRFGPGNRPAAIILTHGHFDHVGGVVFLAQTWEVPVYAHSLEFPYLTGKLAYPKPDSSVEGGLLAKLSFIYPIQPVNITPVLHALPMDGSVPYLPEWRWIATPGHSPGQVALFRDRDKTLLSADAFITVRQDALYNVLVQKKEVCGPPVYLTTDWNASRESVMALAALNPERVVAGHGTHMEGNELKEGLINLVNNFDTEAIPDHGKWVPKKEVEE